MRSLMMAVALVFFTSAAYADPLTCNLSEYKAAPGLMAAVADDTLALTWNVDGNQELRLQEAR